MVYPLKARCPVNREAIVAEIMAGKPLRERVEGRLKARRCSLCPTGFAPPGHAHCRPCEKRLETARADEKKRVSSGYWKRGLFKIAYWRGCAVGFYEQEGTDKMIVHPIFKDLAALPKCKLINLDAYCPGYDRDQVAMMKRHIRRYYPVLPPAGAC